MKTDSTLKIFLLLVAVACVLLYGTLTMGHGWGDDFAAYVMQAKSLAEGAPGSFAKANEFTIVNSSRAIGPVTAPWGYPLLLAPAYAVFGLNLFALKAVGALSYALFLGSLWFGFRRAHSPSFFLCLAGIFALHPGLLAFPNNLLSDLPFLVLSTLSVVLIGVLVVERRQIFPGLWDSVLLGGLIAAAYFVRTNGALLLVTLCFSQLVSYLAGRHDQSQKRPNRELPSKFTGTPGSAGRFWTKPIFVILVPYVVFSCLFVVWDLFLPSGGASHTSYMQTASLATIRNNLHFYLLEREISAEFFSGVPYGYAFYLASIPLAIAGAIRRIRTDYHAIAYVAMTFVLYAIWPFTQGLRYLFPVLPFYVSFVLSGLEAFQGSSATVVGRVRALACYGPVVVVLFCFGLQSTRRMHENIARDREVPDGPFATGSRDLFSYVSEHTGKGSTIIFFKPRAMRLMTDRKSIMINKADELARGDYLCLYKGGTAYNQVSVEIVEALMLSGSARLIYDNGDFKLYSLGDS